MLYGMKTPEHDRMWIPQAGLPLTCLWLGVGLRHGHKTSDLFCVIDKVAPCGYLFNPVDARLEQELGGLPMTPKE